MGKECVEVVRIPNNNQICFELTPAWGNLHFFYQPPKWDKRRNADCQVRNYPRKVKEKLRDCNETSSHTHILMVMYVSLTTSESTLYILKH